MDTDGGNPKRLPHFDASKLASVRAGSSQISPSYDGKWTVYKRVYPGADAPNKFMKFATFKKVEISTDGKMLLRASDTGWAMTGRAKAKPDSPPAGPEKILDIESSEQSSVSIFVPPQ
jgi:hypothetical protein